MKKILIMTILLLSLTSCNDADVVSRNLSKDADNFKVDRRIVFYNWITWDYILEIIGKCSIWNDNTTSQFTVTCKVWEDKYKKHFLWLSDNVTFFAEQIDAKNVSDSFYKVIFKPSVIIPDIELR